jgi:hypothetical protein
VSSGVVRVSVYADERVRFFEEELQSQEEVGEWRFSKGEEMRREEDGRSSLTGRPNRVILGLDSVRHATLMTRQKVGL